MTTISLELPPYAERIIKDMAVDMDMSVEDYILYKAISPSPKTNQKNSSNDTNKDMLVTDFMATIPPLDIFKQVDPVAYQRELRNEWD